VIQQSSHHPYSTVLRQRAAGLHELAAAIERSLVVALGSLDRPPEWTGGRARLCEQMLARNLHQLHRAADDLRDTAFRFRRRADELDLAHRARSAA
jgi:hypothetical protein